MNIAVLGQGTRGDLYPLLGVARSLVARGHQVHVLEYDEYEPDVAAAGLDFRVVGTGSQCARVFANVPAGRATRRSEWVTDRLYFEASLDSARHFVAALARLDPKPDAIVAPCHHIGAILGRELLGVPLVTTFLGTAVPAAFDTRSPSGFRSRADERTLKLVDRIVLPRIAGIRRALGPELGPDLGPDLGRDLGPELGPAAGSGAAPGDVSFARVDREGGLVLCPAPLAAAATSIPATFEIVGYPDFYGPDSVDEPTRRFVTEGSRPVVVCTLGDGWARALPDQLRGLAERADQGRYRLLIVGGRVPGLTPGPGTRILTRANLRELLRFADVSVNHGGMGTLVAALRNAVPSVVMSQWPDGRRNAAALAARGLGTDLGSAPTAEEIFRAVDDTAGDDGLRDRLRTASAAMRLERDPADALLERLGRLDRFGRLGRQTEGRRGHVETSAGRGGSSR